MQRTILQILWRAKGAHLRNRQIWEMLRTYGFHGSKSTVPTVTDRMAADGLLIDEQVGFDHVHNYGAAVTAEEVALAMQETLEDVCGFSVWLSGVGHDGQASTIQPGRPVTRDPSGSLVAVDCP